MKEYDSINYTKHFKNNTQNAIWFLQFHQDQQTILFSKYQYIGGKID